MVKRKFASQKKFEIFSTYIKQVCKTINNNPLKKLCYVCKHA